VLAQLEALANKRYEAALRFLRLTGCRLSELSAALWQDMDLERGVWTMPHHKSRSTPSAQGRGSGARGRHPAPRPACRAAAVPPGTAGQSRVPQQQEPPWNRRTLGQHLYRMKKRHGIKEKASLHGIRHTTATQAIAAGASIKLVAAQLGHTTTQITERFYVHDEHLLDGMRAAVASGLPK
jgi:integrase